MNTVTEHKFVCLMHSEAKQTETSEYEAEKGFFFFKEIRTSYFCD